MHFTYATRTDLETLRSAVTGAVVTPGEDAWDQARSAWNLAVDQHPTAVVFPLDVDDVIATVNFAREAGLRINTQTTGHNAGPLGDMRDTILIRTSAMKGVEIDAEKQRARVRSGAIWADVVEPASPLGLVPLLGSAHDVGIAGYSLGGGVGYLGRRYGLATNSLTAIELVTADGEHVRADALHETELFWALRGGGGNFGVVTAMEFALYPVESLYLGALMWDAQHATKMFERWREWTDTVPREITSMARILRFPPLPEIPELVRGRELAVFTAAYLGDAEAGSEVLRPMRELAPEIDTFAMQPPVGLLPLHMDPPEPMPGASDHAMLDELTSGAIDAMLDADAAHDGAPLNMVELRHLGGELAETRAGAGALARLDAKYLAFAGGLAADPEMGRVAEENARRVMGGLAPWSSGRSYLNFAEQKTNTRSAYPASTYQRLLAIRSHVDPDGLFRANHEIPPAA